METVNEILVTNKDEYFLEIKDTYHPCRFSVKWDGCVHFWKTNNAGSNVEDEDYMHICDLRSLIQTLQTVETMAKQHFGNGWPNE